MKPILIIFLISQLIFISSCKKDNGLQQDIPTSEVWASKTQNDFTNVLENHSGYHGDPFELISISIENGELKIIKAG